MKKLVVSELNRNEAEKAGYLYSGISRDYNFDFLMNDVERFQNEGLKAIVVKAGFGSMIIMVRDEINNNRGLGSKLFPNMKIK